MTGRRGHRLRGIAATVVALVAITPLRAQATPDLETTLGLVVDAVDAELANGVARVVGRADAVLLSFDGDAPHGVRLRRHGPDGWGEWVDLHDAPDEAPDIGAEGDDLGRTVLGPVWTGRGTDAIEIVADDDPLDLERLTVELLRSVQTTVDDLLAPIEPPVEELLRQLGLGPDVPRPPTTPAILPPQAWGSPGWSYGTPGCEKGPQTAPLHRGILHHTVTANGYSPADVPAMLRAIYYGHRARGWCDIAYNFVVDAFGRIWQARSGPVDGAVIGGHARGWNTGSVGIALLGQHHPGARPSAAAPSGAALDAVADLAAWKFRTNHIGPELVGHRNVGATACPGESAYARLDDLRAAIAARM